MEGNGKLSSKMKVLIIQPSRLNPDGTVYHHKTRWLLGMTAPYVAALVPPDMEVAIKDDCYETINFDEPVDLVALTFMSHQAPRAYQVAAEYRKRNVPVVMGGFHATLDPEEAKQHADAIVIGEAEYVWEEALRDFANGHPKQVYRSMKLHDLRNLPVPRYDLIDVRRYRIPNIPAQTSRGCPYGCSYCEVTQVYGAKFRHRPTDDVIEEVRQVMAQTKKMFVYFVDDIFNANKKHAVEVCEKLMPLNVKWTCLCTANIGDDKELLALMKRSGCLHINIGMETISAENLKLINKKQNKEWKYVDQLRAIREADIDYSINIMFGLDGDKPDVFANTVEFLIANKVPTSYMFILAPRVGLKIREQLKSEGRILYDDWTKYSSYEAVFAPKGMTKEELEKGFWWAQKKFYSLPSIFRRLLCPPTKGTLQALVPNLFFSWGVRWGIHPLMYY